MLQQSFGLNLRGWYRLPDGGRVRELSRDAESRQVALLVLRPGQEFTERTWEYVELQIVDPGEHTQVLDRRTVRLPDRRAVTIPVSKDQARRLLRA